MISGANGQLWLAAGQSVEIADPGSPDLRVVVTAPRHQSLDIGKIVANTERSGIYAALAARAGPPRANGVTLAADGRMMLTSTGNSGTRGHSSKSHDSHGQAAGGNRSQASDFPGQRSVERDLNVKAASVHDKVGTRGHSSKSHDSHKQATGSNRSQVSASPGPGSEESNLNVNAASAQVTASHAVAQQTDAARDTGDPVIGNTAKHDSNKSKSGVCS